MYHLAALLGRTHEVHVVYLRREGETEEAEETDAAGLPLASLTAVDVEPLERPAFSFPRWSSLLLRPWPSLVESLYRSEASETLRGIVSRRGPFDASVFFTSTLLPYAIDALAFREAAGGVFLVPYDSESLLAFRSLRAESSLTGGWARTLVRALKYLQMERRCYAALDGVCFVAVEDAAWQWRISPQENVEVIPNGIDVDFFSGLRAPVEKALDPMDAPDAADGGGRLLFVGVMNPLSVLDGVLWFVENVWPLVRRERPAASFWLVGRRPPRAVLELDGRAGVRVTGYVPDVRPYLRAADLFVAPFRFGGGMKQKVPEALSAGLPVVATRFVEKGLGAGVCAALEDLHLVDDTDPAGMAERILELLRAAGRESRAERIRRVSSASVPVVRRAFGWETAASRYAFFLGVSRGDDSGDDEACPLDTSVSFVIPAWNAECFVGECIESVLRQLPPELEAELLVVDDCSEDDTARVVESFGDERIRLLRPSCNLGASGARNLAIGRARGEIVFFLDADDVAMPCRVGATLRLFRLRPFLGMAYGGRIDIDEDGRRVGGPMHAPPFSLEELFRRNYIFTSSVAARREVLLEAGPMRDSMVAGFHDWDLWLRIAMLRPLAPIGRVVLGYRVNPAGLTLSSPPRRHEADRRESLKWRLRYLFSCRRLPLKTRILLALQFTRKLVGAGRLLKMAARRGGDSG